MKHLLLVAAVLLGALACPVAAQTDPGQSSSIHLPNSESGGRVSAADVISLENIRRGLRASRTETPLRYGASLTAPVRGATGLPVYRIEVVARRGSSTTLQESLRVAVADRWPSARPGYLDGAPGVARAGVPIIGASVGVDPMIVVRLVQRWSHKRAEEKAKREVAEELDALLAAQAAAARKGTAKQERDRND